MIVRLRLPPWVGFSLGEACRWMPNFVKAQVYQGTKGRMTGARWSSASPTVVLLPSPSKPAHWDSVHAKQRHGFPVEECRCVDGVEFITPGCTSAPPGDRWFGQFSCQCNFQRIIARRPTRRSGLVRARPCVVCFRLQLPQPRHTKLALACLLRRSHASAGSVTHL